MLVEIADKDIFRPGNRPLVRHQHPRDDVKKRTLSLAVGAYQSDVLARQQAECHIPEDGAVAESVGKILNR